MDVWCEICGHKWDSRDPAVTYWHGDGRWECQDETQCFARRSMQKALDRLAAEPVPDVTGLLRVVPE